MARKRKVREAPIEARPQIFAIEMAPRASGQRSNITVTIESTSAEAARRIAESQHPEYAAVSFVSGKKLGAGGRTIAALLGLFFLAVGGMFLWHGSRGDWGLGLMCLSLGGVAVFYGVFLGLDPGGPAPGSAPKSRFSWLQIERVWPDMDNAGSRSPGQGPDPGPASNMPAPNAKENVPYRKPVIHQLVGEICLVCRKRIDSAIDARLCRFGGLARQHFCCSCPDQP